MAAENKEPGITPALFQRIIERNIAAWKSEVRSRVDHLVSQSLDTGKPVPGAELRKIGPDGERYFYRVLRQRMEAQIVAAAQLSSVAEAQAGEPSTASKAAVECQRSGMAKAAKIGGAPMSSFPTPLVVATADWKDRHCVRPSFKARAKQAGWKVAVAAILAAIAFLHLSESALLAETISIQGSL